MRLRISQLTTHRYETPAASVIQVLRVAPRNHDGQYVARWRIDVSADCRLDQHEDAFGNITHAFTAEGPLRELSVAVEGEIETRDTQGIVRGAAERFPPSLFLRATSLTHPDERLVAFAAGCNDAAGGDLLQLLHGMLARVHAEIANDADPTQAVTTTAAQAFACKRGAGRDLTHIFIAASRCLGVPARYVGGYFHHAEACPEQSAGHAWAEAFVPNLGWIGFDPVNGICATDAHVRVAAGLDHLGAAPLRGTRYGGAGEMLSVKVRIDQALRQSQNQ